VREVRSGKIGYLRKPIQVRDFRGNALTVSDIQFLAEVTDTTQQKYLPLANKNGILVAPYPYREVHKSCPLFCYFEIYNIIASGVTTEYEIALRVTSDKSRKSTFKRISNWVTGQKDLAISLAHYRSVLGDTDEELVAIDFNNVANGPYYLEIIVTDTKNEMITASVRKEITVVN